MCGHKVLKQLLGLMGLILFAVGGSVGRSEAASTLVFKVVGVDKKRGGAPFGRIYAGPEGVMTLGGHGWKSLPEAEEVARRLNALAEAGLRPEEITVERRRRSRLIVARGRRVLEVDRAIAKVHRSDPAHLARLWADNLRSQFGQPYLSATPIVVPLGESRLVSVLGNVVGEISVRAATPVVSVAYDRNSNQIRVLGEQVGRTELVMCDERSVLRVPVRAAKYAARLSQPLVARVTGNPAPTEVVARAVKATVGAAVTLEPGAWATVRPWVKPAAPLGVGRSRVVPVRVAAAGEEYLPFTVRASVAVHNEAVSEKPADLLMVSNSPERLLSQGLWFEGTLGDAQSARLFYHHVNGTGSSGELAVELWNLGEKTAYVQCVAGTGGPSRDESWAGHRAANEFLGNRAGNVGWIIPVPPRTAAPVLAHRVTANATASGVVEMRTSAPADLRVRLYLAPQRAERLPYRISAYSESPLLGKWQYPGPRREVSAQYVVGREWAFVTIGDRAVAGVVEGDRLAGNYGVIYDVELDLVNPTAEPAPVLIALEPAGGPARGTVLIDGRPAEAAVLYRDSEAELARYILGPGEGRRVHIRTMPQGGSNYPVRLVARPI